MHLIVSICVEFDLNLKAILRYFGSNRFGSRTCSCNSQDLVSRSAEFLEPNDHTIELFE